MKDGGKKMNNNDNKKKKWMEGKQVMIKEKSI